MEVGPILGGGEVHLDVVEGLALAEIVVIRRREEPGSVSPDDGLQVSAMDVECHSFESVHFLLLSLHQLKFLDEITRSDLREVFDLNWRELRERRGFGRERRTICVWSILSGR